MYQANIIQVFIASPSDLTQEREIIKLIINEWNIINSYQYKIILQPIGWEDNVYASLEGRAQDIINKQILDNADLLVGCFWTRIGTATGNFKSGSVEEIHRHINANKPAMIYFSNKSISPDKLNQDQYSQVSEFKNWSKEKGVIFEFDNIDSFKDLFRKQLALIINSHDYFKNSINNNNNKPNKDQSNDNQRQTLSQEAILIIQEMAKDSLGSLIVGRTLGRFELQTNGKVYGANSNEPRIQAKLESIINELEIYNLIKAANHKREIFKITINGFSFIDKLNNSTAHNSV